MRLRYLLVVVLSLVVVSCARQSESEALARLSATEAAARPLFEVAVGAEAMTSWEREPGADDWFCSSCSSTGSRMEFRGDYSREVLDRFGVAAQQVGARAGAITEATMEVTPPGEPTQHLVLGWDRVVSLGAGLYDLRISVDFDTGTLSVAIHTGSYEPSS